MNRPVVRLVEVGRDFPGTPPVTALREASFSVVPGEHVAIMGPSGSGKSTLLNLIGLLDNPTRGLYELDGRDATRLSDHHRTILRRDVIGFVFQDSCLMPGRAAWENVALPLVYAGLSAGRRADRSRAVLDRLGLGHLHDALPSTMSGGECQRVAIARALVNRPSLLLCDEPTGNLDSSSTKQVMELLSELNREGMTIVTITHDEFTASYASRRLVIVDGRVLG